MAGSSDCLVSAPVVYRGKAHDRRALQVAGGDLNGERMTPTSAAASSSARSQASAPPAMTSLTRSPRWSSTCAFRRKRLAMSSALCTLMMSGSAPVAARSK